MRHLEEHRTERIGWLRAAVLGVNDGIVSTASLVVGVAAAETSRESILVAGVAGLVAGAMSMAAGEYVSSHFGRNGGNWCTFGRRRIAASNGRLKPRTFCFCLNSAEVHVGCQIQDAAVVAPGDVGDTFARDDAPQKFSFR